MMNRVVFPKLRIMEAAVNPIGEEIGDDHKRYSLEPQRHCRQGAKTVVVELYQVIGTMNAVDVRSAQHQHSDAQEARHDRDQEPVADVGHDLAFPPPWAAWIARRQVSQHRKYDAEGDRYREQL